MEEIKYCGKFVSVKEKIINGQTWEMVTIPDSLVVIPITSKDEIIFIVESRPHETPNKRLKLVTGHIDSYESPIDCANRELQEEAGFKAKDLEEIMVHRSTGTINSNFHKCPIKMQITLNSRLRRIDKDLLSSSMADETVMMNVSSGDYLGLNEVATTIWGLLEEEITTQEICTKLLDAYDIDEESCIKRTLTFLEELQGEKMITVMDSNGDSN